ncbi:hypothetical protein B0H94_11027 [Salsuginibacillus halophilus]|uniref:DUF1499 domain-containing protein n=1 Tax=Salsuginibacillus halophilus TaxID=517424 RepID=A0A2P8HBF2_9BACI|nr:hypothetical protein [Salsuginibacillus halophilus]PSL43552.1 hypothetical protein B0H94_11027 [Salsuginibacillus halophilus]
MNVFYAVSRLFRDSEETKDNTTDDALRSRYYQASVQDVLDALSVIAVENVPGEIVSQDLERGEVMIHLQEGSKIFDMTVTVIPLERGVAAVDIVSNVRNRKGDLTRNRKWIHEVLKCLDHRFERIEKPS